MKMIINDETSLFIDESEKSISTEPIYMEIVKRTSRNTMENHEYGLPPTGKQTTTRVRMRSRPTRTYQLQQPTQFPPVRPASFHELSPSNRSSTTRQSAVDTFIQITTHQTPSLDSSDFLGEMSLQQARSLLNSFEQKNLDYQCIETKKDYATRHKSTINRSCLKTHKSRIKKSVHFDSHPPTEIRPSLTTDDEKEEVHKIHENARRTHIVHRSFSLSPSPSSKEENHHNRKHRQVTKKTYHNEFTLNTETLRNQSNKGYKRSRIDIDDISKVTINHPNDIPTRIDNRNSSIHDTFNPKNTKRSSMMIKSDQGNSLLLQPIENNHSQLTNNNNNMIQTSTLIISTPPQCHYYLYSTTKKKHSRMNSASTNSSSSSSSYELDDETIFSQSKPPIVLSDSVQNFWPPPPSPSQLNNDLEQNNQSQLTQQQEQKIFLKNDESYSMSNTSLPATCNDEDEELRSYSEQSSLSNTCLRIASDSSIEDTQESYSERLRKISRTLKQPVTMNGTTKYTLARSKSKDNLNRYLQTINGNTLRPKSAGQIRQDISNDFQSKRQFFENRTYAEYSNNKLPTNLPVNHAQRHIIKQPSLLPPPSSSSSPPSESTIRTTKYFDTLSNQTSLPPTVYRKPVRVVKAMQRSTPSTPINEVQPLFSMKTKLEHNLHLSSEYIKHLFPTSDRFKQTNEMDNSLVNLKKRLEFYQNNQRTLRNEIEMNNCLANKLLKLVESKGELNEIEKFKLHINDIDTITSIFLKLSCRLAKIENDLLTINTDDNAHTKANLLEQRDKIQQKHDEAKTLKDGIDRRSRLVRTILEKYFSKEQLDEYEHFIRMKSILLIDKQDCEENIHFLQKQLQYLLNTSSPTYVNQSIQTNYYKPISTNA